MSFARDSYTATSSQTDFVITFPYLDEVDVVVTQEGTLLVQGTDYTIPSAALMRLASGATTGDTVIIRRSTSQSSRLVDYTPGVLTEDDLDTDSLQAFYMAQEAADRALPITDAEIWDAGSLRVTNVATPTATTDAANKAYVDAGGGGEVAGINAQTVSYTLVIGDKGKVVKVSNASANNLTVPLNSSVAFAVNTVIYLFQEGAGQTTVVATGGVTIRTPATLLLRGQYSMATLFKIGTDEWVLSGDLGAL
jgi:hypothetical protein